MTASEPASSPRPCGIGLLGFGTVGAGVAELLERHAEAHAARAGRPLRWVKALVRSAGGPGRLDPRFTTDPRAVVADPEVDLVVEVLGGLEPARSLILEAFAHGKSVVTANKAVIATHGPELFASAAEHGVRLRYEAAVAGAVPIVSALKAALAGNRIEKIEGIINGTTNFILTAMKARALSFEAALAEAQALGYAEADPASDVEGTDAAYKLAILAGSLLGAPLVPGAIPREGIGGIEAADVRYAHELGYALKLVARAERTPDGRVTASVAPTLLAFGHPLAAIDGVKNAVAVTGDAAGTLLFSGAGAGRLPTASAVLGDVLELATGGARALLDDAAGPAAIVPAPPEAGGAAAYYVRLHASDEPGVIGAVGAALGAAGVSIRQLAQHPHEPGTPAEIVLVTYPAPPTAWNEARAALGAHPAVRRLCNAFRVESAPSA